MGAGGVQGAVSFPEYIMNFHSHLLADTAWDANNDWNANAVKVTTALIDGVANAANPYYGSSAIKTFTDPRGLTAPASGLLKDIYDAISTLKTAIGTAFNDTDELGDLFDDALTELSTAWSSLAYAAQAAAVKTSARQYVEDIMAAGYSPAGVEEGDFLAEVSDVVSAVDAVGVLSDLTYGDSTTNAEDTADAAITAALVAAVTGLDIDADWTTFISSVITKLDTEGVLTTIALATLISDAITSVSSTMSTFIGALDSGITPTTDYESYITTAVGQADTAGVLEDVDVDSLVSAALSGSDDEIDAAVAKAMSKISASAIQDMVDAYAEANEQQHAAAVRRFTGYMSDINAVQGSAFLFGLAHLHSQKSRDSARHGGEVQINQLNQLQQLHVQSYLQELRTRLAAALANKEARDRFVLAGVQAQLALVARDHQTQMEQLRGYLDNFTVQLRTRLEGEAQNVEFRERAILEHTRSVMSAYLGDIDYKKMLAGAYSNVYTTALAASMQVAGVNKESRERFLSEWMLNQGETFRDTTRLKLQNEMHAQDLERDFYRLYLQESLMARSSDAQMKLNTTLEAVRQTIQLELNRYSLREAAEQLKAGIVFRDLAAYQDYEGGNIELEANYWQWPWQIRQWGANIMAAPSGMSAVLPEKPSKGAAALSGALGGAGLGAQTGGAIGTALGGPGIGTAIGAGAGALIGAGAGLLS